MTYTPEEVDMLISWRDRAAGYRWLHHESMQYYKKHNMRFVHASILLSTVASASSFSFTGSGKISTYTGYAIGGLNVVIGLINSFQRFAKSGEKSEVNGSVAMAYGMLYRLLDTELRLSEEHQRTDLIPFARQEMDRLFANSSMIPQHVIEKYTEEFPNAMHKPELCDSMNVSETPASLDKLASILKTPFNFNMGGEREKERDPMRYPPPPIKVSGVGGGIASRAMRSLSSVVVDPVAALKDKTRNITEVVAADAGVNSTKGASASNDTQQSD